ncbi:hypothetical protein P3339_22425 [Microbulbifer sp. MLAF003]|uniref:hypothetical protein n=1 Tax=Microbulbifer sp. MLAF003 TaxID=3032582 RepID=UPI0024AE5673|nr:hypothetical protein [Microbulbifer sp. MLAF003]WHI51119.1 hypothetical protein P3339_22425 [Microbulbifer sp. MLAF003]
MFYEISYSSFFILISLNTSACIIAPGTIALQNPQKVIKRSKSVFKGKLLSLMYVPAYLQVAKFEVIKIYKGEKKNFISAVHDYNTSCTLRIPDDQVGKNYFVFVTEGSGEKDDLYTLISTKNFDFIDGKFVVKSNRLREERAKQKQQEILAEKQIQADEQ